jgi:hypothetical protein
MTVSWVNSTISPTGYSFTLIDNSDITLVQYTRFALHSYPDVCL